MRSEGLDRPAQLRAPLHFWNSAPPHNGSGLSPGCFPWTALSIPEHMELEEYTAPLPFETRLPRTNGTSPL